MHPGSAHMLTSSQRVESSSQMYVPMLALESTAMMIPCLKTNPSVVVPCAGLMYSITSRSKLSICANHTSSCQRADQ